MTPHSKPLRAVLLLALSTSARRSPAQPPSDIPPQSPTQTTTQPSEATPHRSPRPPQPAFNPNLILLDPAHGGADDGAHLSTYLLEKDLNLAFATRLRTLLTARGFTIILTHENASDELPPDQRVELANRAHPLACLLLHASPAGHGIHLYTSALAPALPFTPVPAVPGEPRTPAPIIPWESAQATAIPQSRALASTLASALNGIRIPLVTGQASIRPIDSLTCPAVALEIAPLGSDPVTSPADAAYQQRIAEALGSALTSWRSQAIAQFEAAQAAKANAQPVSPALKPTPKPHPKPVPIPNEVPDEVSPAHPRAVEPHAVVPIIRKSPDAIAPKPPNGTQP